MDTTMLMILWLALPVALLLLLGLKLGRVKRLALLGTLLGLAGSAVGLAIAAARWG